MLLQFYEIYQDEILFSFIETELHQTYEYFNILHYFSKWTIYLYKL